MKILTKQLDCIADFICLIFQARIQMMDNLINMDEWRWLLAGGSITPEKLANPAPDWISDRSWGDILMLAALVSFIHN